MMDFVLAVIVVLGGAATFVYGLKLLGEGTEKLVGAKLKKFVAGCVEKPFGGFLAGAAVAGVTQSSAAVTMVAVQVMGNDAAIGFAASQGNFQLNVFLPVTIYNFLQSVRLLGDAMESFRIHCALGIKANKAKMKENLHRSLMLVTALTPYIGYEKAAEVAKLAHKKNLSLKEAILELGYMTETDFDAHFHPEKMV